jgi:hypothetical protein
MSKLPPLPDEQAFIRFNRRMCYLIVGAVVLWVLFLAFQFIRHWS